MASQMHTIYDDYADAERDMQDAWQRAAAALAKLGTARTRAEYDQFQRERIFEDAQYQRAFFAFLEAKRRVEA